MCTRRSSTWLTSQTSCQTSRAELGISIASSSLARTVAQISSLAQLASLLKTRHLCDMRMIFATDMMELATLFEVI